MMKYCLLWLNLSADLLRFLIRSLRSSSSLAAENLFLRKTARILHGTQNQAPPDLPSSPLGSSVAQPLVQLAKCIDRRDAQNLHRLAP
jgi:hypothetical protein